MSELSLDYETYSEVDLKKTGIYPYMEHPSFDPICLAYSLDGEDPNLWDAMNDPIPIELREYLKDPEVTIRAFNAEFEWNVIRHSLKKHRLEKALPISRFIDTKAVGVSFGLPPSLKDMALAMNLTELKMDEGKELIKLLCIPGPNGRRCYNKYQASYERLFDYCKQDVRTESAIIQALPKQELNAFEQKVWEHTCIQNARGVPIDVKLVHAILEVLTTWQAQRKAYLSQVTDGAITSPHQVARIKNFCEELGVILPNLQAKTIDEYLEKDIAPVVKEVLTLRKQLGRTSTAKFQRMSDSVCKDQTIKGNLIYHGAGTGRFTGSGIMLHNLPRRKEKDPLPLIQAFHRGQAAVEEFGPNVLENASKLLRPCLLAPKGKIFYVSDFSSIENRVLHRAAEDFTTLHQFEEGMDQYKDYASSRFDIPYDDIADDSIERFRGKTAILGLGFGMGKGTYVATVEGYGGSITEAEAQGDIDHYREKYPLIQKLWYEMYEVAKIAVRSGKPIKYKWASFLCKDRRLYMRFPSGRLMCYNDPVIRPEKTPWGQTKMAITFMGRNPYNRKWQRMVITPGRLTENLVQGAARDLLVYAAVNLERAGYKPLVSVHDETISLADESFGSVEEYDSIMEKRPEWAEDLPIQAVGYKSKRYKKA